MKTGEVTPSKLAQGAAQMQLPISNREGVLRKIALLPTAPAGASNISEKLEAAIETSLSADQAYRSWMVNLPHDPAFMNDHTMWQNADFDRAQKLSTDATHAKMAFVGLYNPLAQRFQLATWSPAAF